jgi:CYTH domain-containing protein
MPVIRRFLIAPSLARLIRRGVGASRVSEAHLATGPERHVHVRLTADSACLVLTADGEAQAVELPRVQAEALAEAAAGQIAYDRSEIALDGAGLRIDSFVTPGPLDLAEVALADDEAADAFQPPAWLGPEITGEKNCDNRSIALHNLSLAVEVPITDAIIEQVLDLLDQQELRALLGRAHGKAPEPAPVAGEALDLMDAAAAA